MYTVFIGPDRGLGSALTDRGSEVSRVNGLGTAESLRAAGVERADLLVITDVDEATAVPLSLELNPVLRVVVYAPDTLPEFVRGQVDLAVSPDLLAADVVAEELTDGA